MLHGDGHQDADAIETRLSRPQVAAKWALTDEDRKNGSGLLFFAYGGTQQVDAFLHEVQESFPRRFETPRGNGNGRN